MRKVVFLLVILVLHFELCAQRQQLLNGSGWSGTHSPIKKGNEIFFQGDTLVLVDLEGIKPADQYLYHQKNDTLFLSIIDELSFSCREEQVARYKIFWANNGEKLLLKPIEDHCIERFTLLVSESPWYRKREPGELRLDWHFLDPEKDKVAGTSLYDTYKFLKFRKSTPVIVAVIDCPADYTHQDLKEVLWHNPKEIPDNQTDDDANGFKDDVNGWCFMCSKNGEPIEYEQGEVTRIYGMWRGRFDTVTNLKVLHGQAKNEYQMYLKAKEKFKKVEAFAMACKVASTDSLLYFQLLKQVRSLAKDPVDQVQIKSWNLGEDEYSIAMKLIISHLYERPYSKFDQFVNDRLSSFTAFKMRRSEEWLYRFNPDWNPRIQVGDHPEIQNEKMYGSGFLKTPGSEANEHGTHVAGIIGAKRGNGKGADGIADNVQIMLLGAVPSSGDERDKDVANCIRYAADNGAKIINMSFGKQFSPYKRTLDEAFKYAEKKGILIVKASGNKHDNVDTTHYFPISKYEGGGQFRNWIEVGNSTSLLDSHLVAPSSNYGKKTVDIFAPGTKIYSTTPENTYEAFTGTSMASPVVAGVAALLWSYFPALNAAEIRQAILESAFKPRVDVYMPGSKTKVAFDKLSVTGGIINAKSAYFLAEKLNKKKKAR